MDRDKLHTLLKSVQSGRRSPEEAMEALAHMPYADMGMARVDHHRALRCGFSEVVFAAGKTAEDVVAILKAGGKAHRCMLATRVDERQARVIRKALPAAHYNARA